jgi:Rrf2 family protein
VRLELTKRADYAIRAVVALAAAAPGMRLSVRHIAAAQAIPVRFLPQVMSDLVTAGLVEATTGRSGGYRLARSAGQISILDVVEAVEGDSRRQTCVLRGGPCQLNGTCAVHDVFAATQAGMFRELGGASIASLRRDP